MIGYLIRINIERNDIATNLSIGFGSGAFQWSTLDHSGYATILDHSNLGSISNENSSIYGGTFSLFNDFTLSVCNPLLIDFINTNSIRFVGCSLSVWLVRDSVVTKLINGLTISDYSPKDEITISITAKDSVSLTGISTAKSRITSAMIPSVDKSKLDSYVSTTIANPAWVKLIPCTTSESSVSAINSKGKRRDLETSAMFPRLGDGSPAFPTSFFAKSVVLHDGYPSEILLGDKVFNDLPKKLRGMALEVISGNGKGNVYNISDIYEKDSQTWVVLDKELAENEILPYGDDTRQTGADKSFVRGLSWNPMMYNWTSNNISKEHPIILTTSKTDSDGLETINSEASRFRIANSNALFAVLIDSESTILTDCKGISDSKTINIDVKKVNEIVKDNEYRLISLNYGKSITQESDKIKVNALKQAVAYIDNKAIDGTYKTCDAIYNPSRVDSNHFSKVIHAVDSTSINQFGYSDLVTATAIPNIGTAHYSMIHGSYYYRVDLANLDGLYLGDDSIDDVFPALDFKLSIDQPITSAFRFFIHCRVSIVDDNGVVSDCANYSSIDSDNDSDDSSIWVPPCSINLAKNEYVIQEGCDILGDGDRRINTLINRLKTGLSIGEKLKKFGRSAKYLYIQLVAQTSYQAMTIHQISATLSVRSPGLIYTITVPKDNLWIQTNNENLSNISNPVALLRAFCDRFGVAYNAQSFASCESAYIDSMGLDGSDLPQLVVNGSDSVEDIISKICRGSNISVYSDGSRLYAKWWIADKINNKIINKIFSNDSILKDGYSISRDNGGYISTDFDFSVSGQFDTKYGLSVIPDGNTFPSQSQWTASLGGDISDTIYAHAMSDIDTSISTNKYIELETYSNEQNLVSSPWVVGYYYGITATNKTDSSVLFGVYKCISTSGLTNFGQKIILEKISGDLIPVWATLGYTISAKVWRSMRDWQYLVSGSLIESNDYVTAFNFWDSAKGAKSLLGKSNVIDTRYTKHDIQLFSLKSSWLRALLYLVKHNTYAKSLIKLQISISDFEFDQLLDYVGVSVGPYSASQTSGWILGYNIEPNSDVVSLTIMTAVSDEDVLVYDENGLNDAITIDESGYSNDSISEIKV